MGYNDTKCLFLSISRAQGVVKVNEWYLYTGTYRELVNRGGYWGLLWTPKGKRRPVARTFSRIRMSGIRRPISRVLCRPTPFHLRRSTGRGGHSSGPAIAGRFSRPTRTARAGEALPKHEARARRPYSVLLQAGLAMPSLSPGPRWALTPPFHPCPRPRAKAVCFLWRYPWDRSRRALPAALSLWSPDFPRRASAPRPPGCLALAGLVTQKPPAGQ